MIISIRDLIRKIQKARTPNQYEYVLKFNGAEFVPMVEPRNGNTMPIKATLDDGSELVGLSIVATEQGTGSVKILTNNGMFVSIKEVRATEVMLFTSSAEAKDALEELPHYVVTASRISNAYSVYAAYQNGNHNTLSFRKVW